MNRTKMWVLVCLSVLSMLIAPIAPIAVAQETNLRAAVFVPPNTTVGEFFARFVAELNKQGKGLIQMTLVGPDAVPPFEQPNALRTGVIDMAAVPPAYYTSVMPESDAQTLSQQGISQQRASGAWAAINKLTNQKVNAWYLATYGTGLPFHIYTTKPVTSADFKNFKLRTAPNYTTFFQSLGANVVNTAPGEVQTALERGVVDGYGWPIIGIFDMGWAAVTKYRVDPGFYNVVVNILVNLNRWQSLREDQRAFLNRMSEWAEQENTKWVNEKTGAEVKRQADAGIKVLDFGPEFKKRAHDVYWAELTKRAPEAIGTLRPLLEK